MSASHPVWMAIRAPVSGPQPQGPQIERADADTNSLDWSDPSTSAAQVMGSAMISLNLINIFAAFPKKTWHEKARVYDLDFWTVGRGGAKSIAAGPKVAKSGGAVFTPSAGTSSFAVQTIPLRMNRRKSSFRQFL